MTDIQTTIRTAAEERRRVIVRFRSSTGIEYEREMEPYTLGETDLMGYDYLINGFRTLALRRIESAELTDRHFEPRQAIDMGGGHQVTT